MHREKGTGERLIKSFFLCSALYIKNINSYIIIANQLFEITPKVFILITMAFFHYHCMPSIVT